MAIQDKLISTVAAGSIPAADLVVSSATEAAANSKIQQSEIQESLSKLLESLASNASIQEKDPIKQLIEISPAANEFVTKLQESIFNYKASTPQGLLIKTQLDNGNITLEQFKSAVESISATAAQAQSAVSRVIAVEIQKLLLSLTNDSELKTLKTAITSVTESLPTEEEVTPSNKTDKLLSSLLPVWNKSKYIPEIVTESLPTEEEVTHSEKTDVLLNSLLPTWDESKYTPSGFIKDTSDPKVGTPRESDMDISSAEARLDRNYNKLVSRYVDSKLGFFENMVKEAARIAERNLKASASSLVSLKPQPRIMTGARAVIKINGQVSALCVNVSYDITTEWTEIKGIDELIPNDMAPNSFSVKGSMTLYRVPNGSPIKSYLSQDMFSGILWPYSEIEIKDKRTDELIVLIKRAVITSRSESFVPGQLTATTMSFIGIGFRDEEAPKTLPDKLPNSTNSSIWDRFAGGIKKLNPFS